jgi:hypothetical protein
MILFDLLFGYFILRIRAKYMLFKINVNINKLAKDVRWYKRHGIVYILPTNKLLKFSAFETLLQGSLVAR